MLFDVSSFPAVPFSFFLSFFFTVKLGLYGIKRERKREGERRKKKILHRLNAAPCPHAGVRENALVMEHEVNEDERVSMHFSVLTQILLGSPFTPLSPLSFSTLPLFPFFFFYFYFLNLSFLSLSLCACSFFFINQQKQRTIAIFFSHA